MYNIQYVGEQSKLLTSDAQVMKLLLEIVLITMLLIILGITIPFYQ